jgi:predicted enzyme related to lactoylglutathione lyase
MANPLIFVDLPSSDPEATSLFYADLFGWKFNRRPAGEFHEILPGVKPNLGVRCEQQEVRGPVPRIYVLVDDPPTYLGRALQMGPPCCGPRRTGTSSTAGTPRFGIHGAPRLCCGGTRGRINRARRRSDASPAPARCGGPAAAPIWLARATASSRLPAASFCRTV